MFEIPKQETGSPLTFGHPPMYAAAPLIYTPPLHASPENRAFIRHGSTPQRVPSPHQSLALRLYDHSIFEL